MGIFDSGKPHRWAWSEAGNFLLVNAKYSATGKWGIHRYDLSSGKVETILQDGFVAKLEYYFLPKAASDGNSFYYVRRKFHEDPNRQGAYDYDDRIIRREIPSGKEAEVFGGPEKLLLTCPFDISPDGARLALGTYTEFKSIGLGEPDLTVSIKIVDLNRHESRELLHFGVQRVPTGWHGVQMANRSVHQGVLGPRFKLGRSDRSLVINVNPARLCN